MIKIAALAVGGLVKRFFTGAVVDVAKVLVTKPVEAVKDVVVENIESPEGGEGKVDFPRIIGTIFTFTLVVLYILGYITEEQLLKFVTFF